MSLSTDTTQDGTSNAEDTTSTATAQLSEREAQERAEEEAMSAGFTAVHQDDGDPEGEADAGREAKTTTAEAMSTVDEEEGAGDDGEGASKPAAVEEDPDIPGLGKASSVRQQLALLESMQKQMATAHGHIGHIKSQLQANGKKTITKESLPKVREEFGDEYAEALAADLNAAGIGGPGGFDDESLTKIVTERVNAERAPLEAQLRKVEFKLVRQAHADAPDYFAGGKHNADFVKFVGTLPQEEQTELMNSWDSDVIVPVLTKFKEQREKVDKHQTVQTNRVRRAVSPNTASGAEVRVPAADPMEAGFNRVAKGRAAVGQLARRR